MLKLYHQRSKSLDNLSHIHEYIIQKSKGGVSVTHLNDTPSIYMVFPQNSFIRFNLLEIFEETFVMTSRCPSY